MASIKKKRVSKKNKASWRKHSNVNDVEEFLDDKRQEERIGTFSEKKDEELFQIDVAAPKKKISLTSKQIRKANVTKPLRSLSALRNTSKVQDPIVKRNHVKLKRSGRNIEEEIINPKIQKHIQANKDRLKYYDKLDKRMCKIGTGKEFTKDVWQEEDVRERLPGLKNDWISKDLSSHVLRNTGKGSVKVHDSVRHKTTKAKSFEPPEAGMSYNPSLKEHQDLIRKVIEKEQKIIQLENHLKRVTTDMFSKVTPEERDRRRMHEMATGLSSVDEENEEEEKESTAAVESVTSSNGPVVNKKKSKQKRRKEKERKILNNALKKKKEIKKQRADIQRIKQITLEVDKESQELIQKKKLRRLAATKKKFETKRLGRTKFKEPDTDVNMPSDIAGNLRNVKMESSLLVDRFKNFQKRNILPASVEVGKTKRSKIKRFPRSSHKEPGVSLSKKK